MVSFFFALITTNLRAAVALRGAFITQTLFMVVNNAVYFVTWWLLFTRFPDIGGWTLADMLALYGVAAGAFGLSVACFGGVRDLARMISDGELDGLLTQPKSVLLQAATSRSLVSGWGDVMTSVLFVALSGYLDVTTVPVALLAVGAGCAVITGSGILIHSLAFWLDGMEGLARQVWEQLITFSTYPPTLFDGGLRLLLFTLLPAGFISFLPAQLIRHVELQTAAAVTLAALGYVALALLVFDRGLRRYASGNRILVRS